MKADTFAKLLVLQTLVDSEVGYLLETRSPSMDQFREGLITRVGDLVDEIDALDAVAAAHTYDAIVDFLAQIPNEDAGVVEATLRFQQSLARTIERGMDQRELRQVSTWAVALHELLEELLDDYRQAIGPDGRVERLAFERADLLLSRALAAADRISEELGVASGAEVRSQVQRVAFAVRYRHLPIAEVEPLIRSAQRTAARHRPSPLTRIGAFVLSHVLSRDRRRRKGESPTGAERRKRGKA